MKELFISIYIIALLMILVIKVMEIRESRRPLTRLGKVVLRDLGSNRSPLTRSKRTKKHGTMKSTPQDRDNGKDDYLIDGWRKSDDFRVSQNRKSDINENRL